MITCVDQMQQTKKPHECYEFLDLTDVDDCVKNALASTLHTPAAAGGGGAGLKGSRKQHRPRRRQSNASSVMSSSDGSGVYEYVSYDSRRYPPYPHPVATFSYPVPPEYHHSPQFPYTIAPLVDGTGPAGFGRHPATTKRTGSGRSQDHQAATGRASYHHHHYHQQQQQLQAQSWSPVAVASSSSYTLPNNSGKRSFLLSRDFCFRFCPFAHDTDFR